MQSFVSDKNQSLVKGALRQVDSLPYFSLMKLLRTRQVKVNGARVGEDVTLSVGDKVEIYTKDAPPDCYTEIFSDKNVLIIDKKSGFTSETVFDTICKKYEEVYYIHRLDRNTAGLMVFALNKPSEAALLKGFKNREFDKKYLAVIVGKMPEKEGVLSGYLVKDADEATVKIYPKKIENSVKIFTGYKVINDNAVTQLIEVSLITGKTHQIRAHLAYIGRPIVGDGKYGDNVFNKKYGLNSQLLLSRKITFSFPKDSPLYSLDGKTFFAYSEKLLKTIKDKNL